MPSIKVTRATAVNRAPLPARVIHIGGPAETCAFHRTGSKIVAALRASGIDPFRYDRVRLRERADREGTEEIAVLSAGSTYAVKGHRLGPARGVQKWCFGPGAIADRASVSRLSLLRLQRGST